MSQVQRFLSGALIVMKGFCNLFKYIIHTTSVYCQEYDYHHILLVQINRKLILDHQKIIVHFITNIGKYRCFMGKKSDRDLIMGYNFHNLTAKRHLGQLREKIRFK